MRAISYAAQDRLLKASATANTSSTDPYRTPIASPASMRPKREFASKGKPSPEKPDAEVKMAPPPPRKRGSATVGTRQQQAAVLRVHAPRVWSPLRAHASASAHLRVPFPLVPRLVAPHRATPTAPCHARRLTCACASERLTRSGLPSRMWRSSRT